MALIVQKFGGTSVANAERIKEVVKIIQAEIACSNKVIVVTSAMAGITNHLITLCQDLSSCSSLEELAECDSVLSSGEIVSSALLALALTQAGINARSVLAWQLPITTNHTYGKALVQHINTELIDDCLAKEIVPIIAGFQGVNELQRTTTLGRGGSDTTALAIAVATSASYCEIYTDVEGIFSADPRIIHNAKKLDLLHYYEMLEFASSGAKVVHSRAVAIAMRYNIDIWVKSAFTMSCSATNATLITGNQTMENRVITGITANKNLLIAEITSSSLSFAQIALLFAEQDIHVQYMLNMQTDNHYRFIIPLSDKNPLDVLLAGLHKNNQINNFSINTQIAAIALVGFGINNDLHLPSIILNKLTAVEVEILMLQVSDIKILLLIKEDDAEKAIKLLHELI